MNSKIFFLALFLSFVAAQLFAESKNIMQNTEFLISYDRNMTFPKVKKQDFQKVMTEQLSYGYSPPFDVWIRFTLSNDTNRIQNKILEHTHPLTTDITFYDRNHSYKEGLYSVASDRFTLSPIFPITLKPHEQQTYYLKNSSNILPLIIELKLWDTEDFYKAQMQRKFFLALFFGAMGVLFVYNLFIFFFTRDKSYLYYCIYQFGMTFHHALYTGVAYGFMPQPLISFFAVDGIYAVILALGLGLALFIKNFLQLQQYRLTNKLLNIYMILMPLFTLLSLSGIYSTISAFFFLSGLLFIIGVSVYAAFKKNRQAYFIVAGWLSVFIAFLLIVLSGSGLFSIFEHFQYSVEIGLLLEAIIFSIALADRINTLQKAKLESERKLFRQMEKEEERLKQEVAKKTAELSGALEEKEMLFKELNHRVKNNMQMIISLLRLKGDRIEDTRIKEIITGAELKISAMSRLHELLYSQEQIAHIDSQKYITMIVDEIYRSYHKNVAVSYAIDADLEIENAIYCGIIINELVTNAYKYAFTDDDGWLLITLHDNQKHYKLIIQDSGNGPKNSISEESFGLKLVNMLVTKQLKGTMESTVENGYRIKIIWSKNG